MKNQNCKIVCNGKEIATFSCTTDGINIKCTKEGKKMCKELCKGCC